MTSFVDVHLHPPTERFLHLTLGPLLAGPDEPRELPAPVDIDEVAEAYRARNGRAVVLGWDAQTATGASPLSSAHVAEIVESHPDVFVGFGSVDPHKGAKAISGVAEAKRLGLKGLAFHPAAQRFDPTDRRYGSIWEVAEELDLVVLVHSGFTDLGAGRPGGAGVEIAFANPMLLDRVAADFGDLRILISHPGWPWQDELLAVALHKPNVWIELSGGAPTRMTPGLLEAVQGPLRDRTVIGTGIPKLDLDEWLAAWERAGLDEAVAVNLRETNATRLLGL